LGLRIDRSFYSRARNLKSEEKRLSVNVALASELELSESSEWLERFELNSAKSLKPALTMIEL